MAAAVKPKSIIKSEVLTPPVTVQPPTTGPIKPPTNLQAVMPANPLQPVLVAQIDAMQPLQGNANWSIYNPTDHGNQTGATRPSVWESTWFGMLGKELSQAWNSIASEWSQKLDSNSIYVTGTAAKNTLSGAGADDQINGDAGDDTLFGNGGNDMLLGGAGNDKIFGGNGADALSGGEGDDKLSGDAGDDFLFGNSGNDVLMGDAGNDKLLGGIGNDRLAGSLGNDRLQGGEGDDKLYGGDGKDRLVGEAGNDELYGENGSDGLYGDAGNDAISGGRGADWMSGGAGEDTFKFALGDGLFDAGASPWISWNGYDVISDFEAGIDKIDLSALVNVDSLDDIAFTNDANGTLIKYASDNYVYVYGYSEAQATAGDFIF